MKPIDRATALVAICGLVVSLAIVNLSGRSGYFGLRERAHDAVMSLSSQPDIGRVTLVDIDRATLDETGGWPWDRRRIAELLQVIAAARPRAVAVDILLEGADRANPRQIVGRLASETGRAELAVLAPTLPDHDQVLADVIATQPIVLGVGLEPEPRGAQMPSRSLGLRGRFDARGLWTEPGLVALPKVLGDRAAGLGLLSIPGDPDGVTRRVPLLALAGDRLVPGLAVDVLRVSRAVSLLVVDGAARTLSVGDHRLALTDDGTLRLAPLTGASFSVVAARDLLSRKVDGRIELANRTVILGSSAPEAGGLRTAHDGDPAPTLHLQAMALAQLEAGQIPQRPFALRWIEWASVVVAAFGGSALGLLAIPVATASALGLCALWIGATVLAWHSAFLLLDPVIVPLAVLTAFVLSAIVTGAITRVREARLRRRFEQHLAPAVVSALVARPDALKLDGQVRIVTALFTDVQGFSAMTARAAPHDLIAALDRYFDGIATIVIAHGGMVDKIVGDAVHAIFNAPLDTPDHATQAISCARAIDAFARTFQDERLARSLAFGLTRIGLETGSAIVGDVGGQRKLDYTAHGAAVNMAARLESANKELGTRIAIGAGTKAASGADLRALGLIEVRGFGTLVPVFTIWPDDMSAAERMEEAAAVNGWIEGDSGAASRLADLATQRPYDEALRQLVARAIRE